MRKRKTTDDFIKQANIKHNNKYDYSQCVYTTTHNKVTIVCAEHGPFTQAANSHLSGCGCPKCSSNFKVTTSKFVSKANKIHNHYYDYSNVNYIKSSLKVDIICPIHGSFKQTPNNHLSGQGCPKCGKGSMCTEQFITNSISVHGSKYCYESSVFTNLATNISITCPVHGEFTQLPYIHLRGSGCRQCSDETRILSTSEFVRQSKIIHGDKYDYSKSSYKMYNEPIILSCTHHGDWYQTPSNHLLGHGCPKCGNIGFYNYVLLSTDDSIGNSPAILYFIKLYDNNESFFKVGITKSIDVRLKSMTKHYNVEIINSVKLSLLNAFILEQNILKSNQQYNPINKFGGYTECIDCDDESVMEINTILNNIDDTMSFELL